MKLTDEQVETLQPLVSQVAISQARKFPMLDRRDLEQEGWVWILSRAKEVRELLGLEDESESTRLLVYRISRAVRAFGLREKAQTAGYEMDDLHFYTTGELATLLTVVFDPESWLKAPEQDNEQKSRGADPAVGGNWVAILADVSRAYRSLPQDDAVILHMRYAQDMTPIEMARYFSVSRTTADRYVERALTKLQELLGGEPLSWDDVPREYTGQRPRITKAQALAETEQYA